MVVTKICSPINYKVHPLVIIENWMCSPIIEVRQEGREGGGVFSFGHWNVVPVQSCDLHSNIDLSVVRNLVRHAQVGIGGQAESVCVCGGGGGGGGGM